MNLRDRRAIRFDWWLYGIGSFIVLVVPAPLLLLGQYPAAWRWRGLLATDVVGFGIMIAVLLRGLGRVRRARALEQRLAAEDRDARRRLDGLLVELAARRRRGPLS
jgi:hypothetical protein